MDDRKWLQGRLAALTKEFSSVVTVVPDLMDMLGESVTKAILPAIDSMTTDGNVEAWHRLRSEACVCARLGV